MSGRMLEIGWQERSLVHESIANLKIETIVMIDTFGPDHYGDMSRQNVSNADYTACVDVLETFPPCADCAAPSTRLLRATAGITELAHPQPSFRLLAL
jgi:hypothetical protein